MVLTKRGRIKKGRVNFAVETIVTLTVVRSKLYCHQRLITRTLTKILFLYGNHCFIALLIEALALTQFSIAFFEQDTHSIKSPVIGVKTDV